MHSEAITVFKRYKNDFYHVIDLMKEALNKEKLDISEIEVNSIENVVNVKIKFNNQYLTIEFGSYKKTNKLKVDKDYLVGDFIVVKMRNDFGGEYIIDSFNKKVKNKLYTTFNDFVDNSWVVLNKQYIY